MWGVVTYGRAWHVRVRACCTQRTRRVAPEQAAGGRRKGVDEAWAGGWPASATVPVCVAERFVPRETARSHTGSTWVAAAGGTSPSPGSSVAGQVERRLGSAPRRFGLAERRVQPGCGPYLRCGNHPAPVMDGGLSVASSLRALFHVEWAPTRPRDARFAPDSRVPAQPNADRDDMRRRRAVRRSGPQAVRSRPSRRTARRHQAPRRLTRRWPLRTRRGRVRRT